MVGESAYLLWHNAETHGEAPIRYLLFPEYLERNSEYGILSATSIAYIILFGTPVLLPPMPIIQLPLCAHFSIEVRLQPHREQMPHPVLGANPVS